MKTKLIFPGNTVEMSISTDDMVIVNHTDRVWSELARDKSEKTVDVILDNAGFELVADLCLAMFLLDSGLASKVRLHCKRHPWFVSDTTRSDITRTLKHLSGRCPWKLDSTKVRRIIHCSL